MENNIKKAFLEDVRELHGSSVAEEVEKRLSVSGNYSFNSRTATLAQVLVEQKEAEKGENLETSDDHFLELVKNDYGEEVLDAFLKEIEGKGECSSYVKSLLLANVLAEIMKKRTPDYDPEQLIIGGCSCCNRVVSVDPSKRTRFWDP